MSLAVVFTELIRLAMQAAGSPMSLEGRKWAGVRSERQRTACVGQFLALVKRCSTLAPGLLYSARKAPGSEFALDPMLLAMSMGSSGGTGPATAQKSLTLAAAPTAAGGTGAGFTQQAGKNAKDLSNTGVFCCPEPSAHGTPAEIGTEQNCVEGNDWLGGGV